MRDIRTDLEERIRLLKEEYDHIVIEKGQLEERQDRIVRLIQSLGGLLEIETGRWGKLDQQELIPADEKGSVVAKMNGHSPLSRIILEAASDGKARPLDAFVQEAERRQYPFGSKKPGRVVHFALLALKNAGKLEVMGDKHHRKWKLR